MSHRGLIPSLPPPSLLLLPNYCVAAITLTAFSSPRRREMKIFSASPFNIPRLPHISPSRLLKQYYAIFRLFITAAVFMLFQVIIDIAFRLISLIVFFCLLRHDYRAIMSAIQKSYILCHYCCYYARRLVVLFHFVTLDNISFQPTVSLSHAALFSLRLFITTAIDRLHDIFALPT